MNTNLTDTIMNAGTRKENFEYLDIFLKILAGENLTVIHSPEYETAWCDIENRVIGIPEFSTPNKHVMLLMSAHEVGHALFTPKMKSHDELSKLIKNRGFFTCLNIVEDIRQERLLRNSFRGLHRSFLKGYEALLAQKFFGDMIDTNIADRVNLMGKLGKACPIPVSTEDIAIFRYVRGAKTFSDAVIRAKFLYEKLKEEHENKMPESADEPGDGASDAEPGEGTVPRPSPFVPEGLRGAACSKVLW